VWLKVNCKEAITLIHEYLDGNLDKSRQSVLHQHIQQCGGCRKELCELERTDALVRILPKPEFPSGLTECIVRSVPVTRRQLRWLRWAKKHPALFAAAVFALFMTAGILFMPAQDAKLAVRGNGHFIIDGDRVIVPEGERVEGDLVVEHGKVQVDGEVSGNITVIDGTVQLASSAHIAGEVQHINQTLDWFWFKIKDWFQRITG
jgi:anti-sigma factor RsiW